MGDVRNLPICLASFRVDNLRETGKGKRRGMDHDGSISYKQAEFEQRW